MTITEFRPTSWVGVIASYLAASAVQVLLCWAAVLGGGSGSESSASVSRMPSTFAGLFEVFLFLIWLLVPVTLATIVAVRRFRFGAGIGTSRLSVPAAFAILLLPVLSMYLGGVIAVNIWGS